MFPIKIYSFVLLLIYFLVNSSVSYKACCRDTKSQIPLRYSWFEAGSKLVGDQLRIS